MFSSFRSAPILITGGTGFLGHHLTQRLVNEDALVTILSETGSLYRNCPLPKETRIIPCDLKNLNLLKKHIRRIKPLFVFHLSATVKTESSLAIAKECLENNILATWNLLEALQGTPLKLFVYTSSTDVYGASFALANETQRENPMTPYAISKLAAEELCRFLNRTYQFPYVILRISSCYGPGQNPRRLIPSLIYASLHGKSLKLANPYQRRDFLFAEDAADGILLAAKTSKAQGETINLASGFSPTISEIIKLIEELTKRPLKVQFEKRVKPLPSKIHPKINVIKAEKLLGWEPKTTLREGLQATINWFKKYG